MSWGRYLMVPRSRAERLQCHTYLVQRHLLYPWFLHDSGAIRHRSTRRRRKSDIAKWGKFGTAKSAVSSAELEIRHFGCGGAPHMPRIVDRIRGQAWAKLVAKGEVDRRRFCYRCRRYFAVCICPKRRPVHAGRFFA